MVAELHRLWQQLNVEDILSSFTESISKTDADLTEATVFVLELNTQKKEVKTLGFTEQQLDLAWEKQTSLERENRDLAHIDVVMVSAESLSQLRDAFPNYYLDTAFFLSIIGESVNYEGFDDFYDDFEGAD